MSDDAGILDTLTSAYSDAVERLDVDALLGLYREDARVFDLWSDWQYRGHDEWRPRIQMWFDSSESEGSSAEFVDMQIEVVGDAAFVSGFVAYTGLPDDGDDAEEESMDNRITWALVRDGERWLIAHEHTSIPIDDEGEPIFTR